MKVCCCSLSGQWNAFDEATFPECCEVCEVCEVCEGGEEVTTSRLNEIFNKLYKQLPEGMESCTILFKECPKGHGRLTATNWVQHECSTCRIRDLQDEIRDLERELRNVYKNYAY